LKIETDKYYLDGWHSVIRVLCVDRPNSTYPVVGVITKGHVIGEGALQTYTASGSLRHDSTGKDDLVQECDEHGNPIAPDPAPGQVWKNKYGDYLLNEVHAPQGRVFYVAVNEEGYQCRGAARTPEDAVRGMTFVWEGK
jgi:hypothetical protein